MTYRCRLLIADDLVRGETDLLSYLEKQGFEIGFVTKRDEVVPRLRDGDYNCLILDANQEGDESQAFLVELRLLHPREKLPILVTAATDRTGHVPKALEKGADDVLYYSTPPQVVGARLTAIMKRQALITQVRLSESRMQLASEGSRDGLFDWDLRTDHIYFSDSWKLLLGVPIVDNPTKPDDWFYRVHPDDLTMLRSRLAVHVEGLTPYLECQCRMMHEDQREVWALVRGICERDANNKAVRLVGTITDLTNRSMHDRRTGLPYRDFFMERLDQAMRECQLNHERKFAALQVDIDRFKILSEGFGYDVVDDLLEKIARRMKQCLGAGDTLAFLGGDSFVILTVDSEGAKSAQHVANQIHMQMIAPFQVADTEVFAKASIGIVQVTHETRNRDDILRQAQTAMKNARRLGSGHTEVYGVGMASQGREMLEIESALRTALDRNEFLLYYQPQVHLRSNRIAGFETLLRWRREDGTMIPPGKFIPIAEETDLILTIGEWVLRTACQQSVAWQRQGLPPLRVGVNLSERQFRARNLVGLVRQVLRETGLQPHLLELEITESIFMEDTQEALRTLREFRKLGIKIALDDFGTGYSSLNYLKRIPFTTLKIDKAFIDDLTTDLGASAICSTIIDLAHKMKMEVIAEGVERREQLMILRSFLCDEIQGFFFSKPLPAESFEDLMKKQRPN